jgi:hypothetical protein
MVATPPPAACSHENWLALKLAFSTMRNTDTSGWRHAAINRSLPAAANVRLPLMQYL